MKNTFLPLFLFITCVFFACKKDYLHRDAKTSNKYLLQASMQLPSVQDGILTFENEDHYRAWMEFLDNSVRQDSLSDDTSTTHEIFTQIEQGLGFSSLRKKLDDEFEILNINGWATLESIPRMHFIGDQTILSTLNTHEEVRINNYILTFLDENHCVKIFDEGLIDIVRGFKANGYEDVWDLLLLEEVDQYVNLEIIRLDEISDNKAAQKTTGTLYMVAGYFIGDKCDPTLVSVKDYFVKNIYGTKFGANFEVNWGDGSPNSTHNSIYTVDLSHQYAAPGTYYASVTAHLIQSPFGTYSMTNIPVQVSNTQCNKSSRNISTMKATSDVQRAVSGYLSTTIIYGSVYRVYGSSEAFEWRNSAWRRKKADQLKTEACAEILHKSNCAFNYGKCAISTRKSDAFVQDGFNHNDIFGWKIVYANHDIYYNGTWHNHHQALSPCP